MKSHCNFVTVNPSIQFRTMERMLVEKIEISNLLLFYVPVMYWQLGKTQNVMRGFKWLST